VLDDMVTADKFRSPFFLALGRIYCRLKANIGDAHICLRLGVVME
jgi:hypothetical protein